MTVSSPINALSPMVTSLVHAMRTPWLRNTFFPKVSLAPRAQEISTILNLRDRIVRPSPTAMLPAEVTAQGPSTDNFSPIDEQCRRNCRDHLRIFKRFHAYTGDLSGARGAHRRL